MLQYQANYLKLMVLKYQVWHLVQKLNFMLNYYMVELRDLNSYQSLERQLHLQDLNQQITKHFFIHYEYFLVDQFESYFISFQVHHQSYVNLLSVIQASLVTVQYLQSDSDYGDLVLIVGFDYVN